MQDGQFNIAPNTRFEDLLNASDFGKLASLSNQTKPTNPIPTTKEEALNYIQGITPPKPESPLLPTPIKATDVNISDRYKKQVLGWDNEDLYGQMQSWGSKALNGTLKGLELAGTTFLQGTVGLVYGIGSVIGSGDSNKLFDNDFSNALQDFNNNTENWLPNYYKKEESNAAWYSPKSWFTANFLFDSFIKNLGFSVGAIYSGAAVSKILKAVPLIDNLFTGKNAVKALTEMETKLATVPEVERTAEALSTIRKYSDAAIQARKVGNITERAVISTLGAVTEGGIEALQGVNEHRSALMNDYLTSHGVMPTGDDLQKINDNAESLGNARFLLNIGLLTATNYIQLPKILNSSYKTSKALANLEVNNVVRNAEGKWVDAFSQMPRAGRILSKTANAAGLLFSPTEGFEELGQYAIQLGVQDYYNKAYKGDGRDWVNSISQGWNDAVNSNEGMKQFLIGGLSGGLQQAGLVSTKGFAKTGELGERGVFGRGGERGRNTQSFLSDLNDPNKQAKFKSELWLKDMQDAAARGINLQQEGEALIRQGDVLEAKDNEADYLHNYLSVRIKHGRYDIVKDDIASFQQQASTQEGLDALKKQGIANENDTLQTFTQRLNNFSRHADNVNSLYQSLNLAYSGIVNRQTGERVYSDSVIDKMVYAASKIADYDQRIPELSKDLTSNGIAVNPAMENVLGISTGDQVKEAIKQIEDLSVIETKKDELKQALNDTLELAARRKQFLDEYKELKKNPSKFKDTTTPTVTTSTAEETPKQKITLKTKDGDEELEVGTEYYLGSVVEYDKNGHQVFRFPKLTILGENEDGTIKIKGSDGTIKDVAKSVLEDYKLGRVDDLQNNKKAKFYFDHVNDVFEFNFGKGKKQKGRLQYSPKKGVLNFVYKDKNGKNRVIEVTGDQFVPKKGFNQPMISKIGTLTPVQQKSLEDFAAEKDARIQAKREARIGIVTSLIQDAYNRLFSINDKLKNKYSELEGVQKRLSDIESKIEHGNLTKRQNFKATTKAAIRQATILSKLRDSIVDEIRQLETEQEETEFNISYFEDLGQNIDELPTDSQDFIEELNNQVLDLHILHEETGKQINSLSSILKNVEKALKDAVDFALDLIKRFEKKYPNLPIAPAALREFLNKDLAFNSYPGYESYPSYLAHNPNLMDDLREFDRELADIDELDVIPNERTIKELQDNIASLNEQLKEYEKLIKAKEAILDKFEQIAKEYKAKEAAKKRFAQDKALHDALFKAQSLISEEPADDSGEEDIKKMEDKDWEETKKQDLQQYPLSTAFTTREIDPEFESKQPLLIEEQFLNNFANGTLTDEKGNDITENVRVLVVHQGNQKALGFDGLIELRNPNKATQASTILYVYIAKGNGVWNIIDATGKTIARKTPEFESYKIGEEADINQVVTSVAKTATSISQKSGHYTNKAGLDVKAVEKAWEEERQKLLKSENTVLEIKGVSRGHRQITNTTDKNPIAPTLTSQKIVDSRPVIFVSTTDVINTPNQSVTYKAGRPYFLLGDNLIFLNNRTINKQEADAIFLVLKEAATKFQASLKDGHPQLDKALVDWLNSILYWYSPKANQKAHNHQIYIKSGRLFISGVDTEIYFDPEQLELNRDPIINTFLLGNQAGRGTYHHVSQKALREEGPYVSYYTEDGKTLKTKTYDSYQQYLLENKVVSTNVRPQTSPTDSNIRGRYAIINIDLNLPKPAEKPKPVTPKATKPNRQEIISALKSSSQVLVTLSDGTTYIKVSAGVGTISPEGTILVYTNNEEAQSVEIPIDSITKVEDVKTGGKIYYDASIKKTAPIPSAPKKPGGKFTFEDMQNMLAENAVKNAEKRAAREAGVEQKSEEKKSPTLVPRKMSNEGVKEIASLKLEELLKKGYTGEVSNDEEEEYRRVVEEDLKNTTPENWDVVEKWFAANLPNVPITRVKHLLRMTSGGFAWGKFGSAGITLYEGAKEGTGYHEAFEAVWKLFTTAEEKQRVLEDLRKRDGTFFDVIYGKQQAYNTATDSQLKELLADEFASYVQTEGKIKEKKTQFWLTRVFRELYNFIKNLAKPSQKNIDELFKNINTGWYASRPVNLTNVTEDEFSRVAGLSNQITKELMEDMTSRILNNFFGEKATLSLANLSDNKAIPLDLYFDRIKPNLINKYIALGKEALANGDEDLFGTYINLAHQVDGDWNDIVSLNKEYLKTFGIAKQEGRDTTSESIEAAVQAEFSEDEQANEEEEGTFESENKNQLEYDRDIFTISGKANASAGIRLLLSTIRDAYFPRQESSDPSVLPKIEYKKSSINGYKFISYARAFNQLANALVNTNKIENILNKLIKHARQNPPIVDLVIKLKINTTDGTINYNALSYNDWRILLDFTKTMSKQNPQALVFTNTGSTSQLVPGDKRSGVEQIKSAFTRTIKGAKSVFNYDKKTKTYKINPEFFKKTPSPVKEEDFIKFANAVGFKTLDGEILSLASYRSLSPSEKKQFKSALTQFYTQLKKQEPVYDTVGKALQLATPISTIASSIISMTKDDGVNTFLNILRKPVQSVVLNNPLATFFNNFNSINNINELTQEERGLLEGFSHNSEILKLGGRFFDKDGDRTDEKIEIGYFDGYKTVKGARQSAKLSLINRRLNTFNLNLRGWFIPITNGDKKTEWVLSIGNNISYKEVVSEAMWDRVYPMFQNYLKTEIDVAQTDAGNNLLALKKQGRSGSLRFFLDILPKQLVKAANEAIENLQDSEEFVNAHAEQINKAVKIFIEKEANKTKSEFYQYGIFEPIDDKFYSFNGVDEKFIYDNINDNGQNKWTKDQLNEVSLYRTINQIINNIEIHKLFIGDPAYMTDAAKRIPGAMGGVNQTVYGSEEFNRIFSPLLNRVDVHNPSVALTPKDYGYTTVSEDVPIVVYNDVIVEGRADSKAYKGTNETDGASKMSLPAYREFKTRSAEWTDQQEQQYQYQMAFFRNRAQKWGYKYSSKELQSHDKDLLEKGQPEDGIFEIIKPKGWAQNSNSDYRDVVYLKTSTQPLIPTAIVNTNDEKLLLKMLNSGVKIAAFESAIKTGARTLTPYYDKEGKFNDEKYPKDGILKPTWKDLGIQVETQFSQGKKQLTFGSQLSTLSWLNLLSGGVPSGFTDKQWEKLSEEEKRTQSPAYNEIVTNDGILKELVRNGYQSLIKKLGIEETDEGYKIVKPQAVIDYLLEQSRDMDDNTREALRIDEVTNSLKTPLEAIPTYAQLKAVLYSIVDKNIASPKTSGIGLVQMPSTGTESEERTKLVGNSTYKFYTKDEPWIEVSLPAWFREKLIGFYTRRNIPIPTDEQLLNLLNDSDILEGIGFRIPTQEINSAEVFKIKSFLPKVMGNTVVVPSEITSKAGSDFDIDKLSTYLKNIYINKDGRISKVKSFHSEKEASEFFGEEFDSKLVESKKALEKAKKAVAFKQSKAQDFAEGLLSEQQIEKYADFLDEIFEDFDAPEEAGAYFMSVLEGMGAREKKLNDVELQTTLRAEYISRNTRKSLENAYYESLQRLLQLPENFERLIATNNTKELEAIKNKLNKALFTEEEIKEHNINIGEKPSLSYLSILSPHSLDEIRHNLIVGKDGVGISAAAQKSNSIMQRLPVVLDHNRRTLLEHLDPLRVQYMGDGVIRFPHNTVRGLPTISANKTKNKGNYISDIISQYINGFVDIVKNTFIVEMGINTRTAGTFLFMDRLGNDTEHTTFFMNQPIIREYLKLLDKSGINGIRSKLAIEAIQGKWGSELYEGKEQIPSAKTLLENIEDYKNKNKDFTNLSKEFIEEQSKIFNEFLKYQEMAGDLFNLMQGITWDTAHMSDPEQFLLKEVKLWKANNTIFTPASEILSKVFIGDIKDNLLKARDAIGGYIALEHPRVRAVLNELKKKFINPGFFPSADDYSKIANRINNAFLSYILQVKGQFKEQMLKNILLDEVTSAAHLLEELQRSTPKDSDIYPILKQFSVERRGETDKDVKAILFRKTGTDKYDRNSDIDNLRILKENAHTQMLYGKLVRASLLQSGMQYTPISFSNLIPNEDYTAAILNPIVSLPYQTDLDRFLTANSFVRNNWSTNGIIPSVTVNKKQLKDTRDEGGNLWVGPFNLPKQLASMPKGSIFTSIQYKGEFVKYQPFNTEGLMKYVPGEHRLLNSKKAFDENDPTLTRTYLYEVVKDENNQPVTIKSGKYDVYLYKAINAWGDGMYAQEHFDSPRPSNIDNNTFKVDENIVNDATILKALAGKEVKIEKSTQPVAKPLVVDTAKKINIYAGTGENAELSNFANRPFEHTGTKFNSVEQAFQYIKGNWTNKWNLEAIETKNKIQTKILATKSASEAKKLGQQYKELDVERWDKQSADAMKALMISSFQQNPKALKALLATGNAELTHTQDRGKWGKEFPRILMEVRNELSSSITLEELKKNLPKKDCK